MQQQSLKHQWKILNAVLLKDRFMWLSLSFMILHINWGLKLWTGFTATYENETRRTFTGSLLTALLAKKASSCLR